MEDVLDFDVVEMYPLYGVPKLRLAFSAHIYIPSLDWDIRGWYVHYKTSEDSIVSEPIMREYDFEEKKSISFPVVSNTRSSFIAGIKKKLLEEAKEKFKSFEFPKGFPKNYWKYYELKNPNKKIPHPKMKKSFTKYPKNRKDKKFIPKKRFLK